MLKTKIKKGILVGILALFLVASFPLNSYASEITREGVVGQANKERMGLGLNSLTVNQKLQTAAQWKADDMIQKDYWEHFHNGKSPWDWMKEAGYKYIDAGENLAIDFDSLEPMTAAWMNSPTHRENILNPKYKEIGIGISSGDFEGHNTIIVVQMFGNPAASELAKPETDQAQISPMPETMQNNFEAKTDENVGLETKVAKKEEPKLNIWQRSLKAVKSLFIQAANNYKDNFHRGFAFIRLTLLQNYSASANN